MTRRVKNGNGESFTLFFTMVSPFSNFHPCTFYECDGSGQKARFSCVEQFYMYMKAALFKDFDTASEVMNERNPKRMKSLGKGVKGFSQQRWDELSPGVMEKALTAKFSQNKQLRWYLFLSQGSQMVEASPMDNVWGIGLPMDSPDAINPRRWRGTNRLGKIMTDVREKLLQWTEFSTEAEEALREIALKGSNVFMDLQSDPQSSAFNTPRQPFKRTYAESDPREAKRQRTMDDYVSTPSSSSYGTNNRFGEREIRTEPRMRPHRDYDDIRVVSHMRRERHEGHERHEGYGSRDTDMRSEDREKERRLRERIASRMGHMNEVAPPRFGQPLRSMLDPPPMVPPMPIAGLMNIPPPGYPPHPLHPPHTGHEGNGSHSILPPSPLIPTHPSTLPIEHINSAPQGVPPPPPMEEKQILPPPQPVPVVIEVQAGVVHTGGTTMEEKEKEKDVKDGPLSSPSVIPSKKSKIKMNLQKERVVYQSKGVEINQSILSLRKKIQKNEEMMKEVVKDDTIEEEVKKEEEASETEGGPPKAYAIKSCVQSEKRRRSTRERKESNSEEEREKEKGEMKKDEDRKKDRRENGDRREDRKDIDRDKIRENRDDSRDGRRKRSISRDRRERGKDSRDDYRSGDWRGVNRDSGRRDERRERGRNEELRDKRSDKGEKDTRRRSSVERNKRNNSPSIDIILVGKNERKEKKKEKKEAKRAEKLAKKMRKMDEEKKLSRGLMEEKKEDVSDHQRGELTDDKRIDGKEDDHKKEKKEDVTTEVVNANGMNECEDSSVNSTVSKRIPVEAPISKEHKKHPRIEAPIPVTTPPTRKSVEQNLYQKLFKKKT